MSTLTSLQTSWSKKHDLVWYLWISVGILLLMTISSILGIVNAEEAYVSDILRDGFVPNDLLNLLLGFPVLLLSLIFAYRNTLLGLLCWAGSLLFVIYIYITYLIAIPFTVYGVFYLLIVTAAIYTLIGLAASLDSVSIREKLQDKVPERVAAGILIAIAAIFLLNQIIDVYNTLLSDEVISDTNKAQWTVDFAVFTPPLVIGGILLWKKHPMGYLASVPLLLAASMLFLGVIPIIIYQDIAANQPISVDGIIVVLVSGLFCFVPFYPFARATLSNN